METMAGLECPSESVVQPEFTAEVVALVVPPSRTGRWLRFGGAETAEQRRGPSAASAPSRQDWP